jgi:tetratricopeptide (TPR) repeat protein
VEYDPLSAYAQAMLAFACVQSGKGKEAVQAASSARQLEESFFTYWASQNALHADRQFEEALAAGEMALALSGRHSWAVSSQAMIFADWGKVSAAQALYAELVARAKQGYMQPSHLAMAASAAGDLDKAVAHAREAFEIRDPMLIAAKYWPAFAWLREDPRFDEIFVRMGWK